MIRTIIRYGFVVSLLDDPKWFQPEDVIKDVIGRDEYKLAGHVERIPRRQAPLIVDVGGNIGCFGLAVKAMWPRASIVAFEPTPELATLYRKNIAQNGYTGVQVFTRAVAYTPGPHILCPSNENMHGNCVAPKALALERLDSKESAGERVIGKRSVTEQVVTTTTLEQAVPDDTRISLLKIDCEGGEFDILDNVSLSFMSRVDNVTGEWHTLTDTNFIERWRARFPEFTITRGYLRASDGTTCSYGPFWMTRNGI